MDGEFFSDLYCEECDTVHFCGEYANAAAPHGDQMVDIPHWMNGACLGCRHPFRARRIHFRMRYEVKPSFPFSFERARCACGWRGPWHTEGATGDDTPMMDAIWHSIIWKSQGTQGETGMAILVGLGFLPRSLV